MGAEPKSRRIGRRVLLAVGAGAAALLLITAGAWMLFIGNRGPFDISVGLFAGSAWDVPNPTVNRLYDGIIADFRSKNPRFSVSYRSGVRTRDYSERLAQDLLRGEEPDLFFILPEDFTTLASIGALADLGPFMKQGAVDPALFYENALSAGRLGNVQYALPFEVVPSLMFENQSLLRRLGLDEPRASWRWEDFLSLAERATADTDGNGALDIFGVAGWSWLDGAYSNDELLFDPSGSAAVFDQDGVIDAVDFYLRLAALTSGTQVSDFESGQVLFAPFPYSSYRAYRYYPYSLQRFGDFKWRALPMPKGPKGKNATELRVLLVGMARRSQRKDAAWNFLVHLTTDEEAAYRILAYSQGLPARKGILFTERSRVILARHISGEEEPLDPEMLDRVVSDSIVVPRFRRHAAALELASRAIVAERPQSPSSLRNFLSKVDRAVESFLKE
jgi:multiple sugar transport system substrate-binding protein